LLLFSKVFIPLNFDWQFVQQNPTVFPSKVEVGETSFSCSFVIGHLSLAKCSKCAGVLAQEAKVITTKDKINLIRTMI
jgi:hypothetical protein